MALYGFTGFETHQTAMLRPLALAGVVRRPIAQALWFDFLSSSPMPIAERKPLAMGHSLNRLRVGRGGSAVPSPLQLMRSPSDCLGLRFFHWVCSAGMLAEAGEGRGVGWDDCDEVDPSRGPA